MALLFDLFLTFFKIGLFTFGGGYAMLSIIEDNCVEKKKWITNDEMMNITVIAEATPGPVAINCSTYVGFKQKGIIGAIFATLGVVLPSFIIIFAISKFLQNFLEIRLVAAAFRGIKLSVGLLILDASIKLLKKMKKNILSFILLLASALILLLSSIFNFHISSVVIMLTSAVIATVAFAIQNRGGKKQ